MKPDVTTFPVIVIGAGPVGLTCAMDLAHRGVEVLVLEQRAPMEAPEPRCNHVSARSMEIFRQLGVAAAVRDAGLPADHPHDVVYSTAFAGIEMGRLRIPSRSRRYDDAGYGDGGWPTAEPPHRINQVYLEPVLFRHAQSLPRLTLRCRFRFDRLEQRDDHVVVIGTDLDSGEVQRLRARYLVGCDGSRSEVRAAVGVQFRGHDNLMRSTMATIHAPTLREHAGYGPAWMHWVLNPRQTGNVIALDGVEQWIVNAFLPPEADDATFDFEAATRNLLGVGPEVPFTISNKKTWVGRRLLAERFSVGRVFLCGDAAHSWLPMAGYGMNAGIADATNISWKLAAVLQGWAGEQLLASYHEERHPVLEQVSAMVMRVRKNNAVTIAPTLADDSAEGQLERERLGRFMLETDSQQFACIGINFGYFYDQSSVIAYDDGPPAPAYSLGSYTPSTVPGCRMPHVWTDGPASSYDAMGTGFALVRLDPALTVDALQTAASARGLPLQVIDLPADALGCASQPLVLVRPDRHVAWRGDRVPADADRLFDQLMARPVSAERLAA